MDELKAFVAIHGRPLEIGMLVKVDTHNEYASDWDGEYLVTGINWNNRSERIDVSIADDWIYGCTDGWKSSDLIPA